MSRSRTRLSRLVLTLFLAHGLVACERSRPSSTAVTSEPELAPPVPLASEVVSRGRARMEHFQCHRCHDGTGLEPVPQEKHCVHCHQAIHAGTLEAEPELLSKWKKNIVHLRQVPSLDHMGSRFRRDWLVAFLQEPHDLRPRLEASMPRLDISTEDAEQLADALLQARHPDEPPIAGGDLARGKKLLETRGCGTCHAFTGAEPLPASPIPAQVPSEQLSRAMVLAPDLRSTRERLRPQALVAWLRDPTALKPGTSMPRIPLSEQEALDLASYLVNTPLEEPRSVSPPVRLPVLERRVTHSEVSEKVFRHLCWHCHSEAAFMKGDGGPGNTGGFGFSPRRINFTSATSINMGMLDRQGERASLFVKDERGVPFLIRVLMARHSEVAGKPVEGLRGMPLGLPPLSLEEIQLIETWIEQGRPLR